MNWACSDRFKTAENQRYEERIENFRSTATETVSSMRSICQSDEDAAVEILNIARNVQNASRMVERVATVIKNQKTDNSILMDLHTVRSASVPVRRGTSLPSEAPEEHLTVGEMLTERRKIDEEKLRKKEEQQKRKDHRLVEGQEVCLEGAKQVIQMHIAFL